MLRQFISTIQGSNYSIDDSGRYRDKKYEYSHNMPVGVYFPRSLALADSVHSKAASTQSWIVFPSGLPHSNCLLPILPFLMYLCLSQLRHRSPPAAHSDDGSRWDLLGAQICELIVVDIAAKMFQDKLITQLLFL
jgi:hypothetical protein